jgi:hypothetical protein
VVERYLRSRGLDPDDMPAGIPAALRFHPALPHRPSGLIAPAMVAAVQDAAGRLIGVHRTWLRPDGAAKAEVTPQRMMLGGCAGGAVRLMSLSESARPGEWLQVGEGVETCLAALLATGQPTWAALSTSGLRTLVLPPEVGHVVILADGDDPGERAAVAAAQRWTAEGRSVRIARPPAGLDLADVLAGRAAAQVTGAAA